MLPTVRLNNVKARTLASVRRARPSGISSSTSRYRAAHRAARRRTTVTNIQRRCPVPQTMAARVALPRTLARPAVRELSRAALAAVNPELAEVPLTYVHDSLRAIGTQSVLSLSLVTHRIVLTIFPSTEC